MALSPYVNTVTGVDYNQGMLAQANKKTTGLSNVKLRLGDVTQLDQLHDGVYDAVIINQAGS